MNQKKWNVPRNCLLEPPLNATSYINGYVGAITMDNMFEIVPIFCSGSDPIAKPFEIANFGGSLLLYDFLKCS